MLEEECAMDKKKVISIITRAAKLQHENLEDQKVLFVYGTPSEIKPPIDNSKEVIVLNQDGTYSQKIKKINNNYYSFNNLYVKGKNLYFVGEIHCAAEDDCQNDTSSLFLVGDEEKVIEVEDNTSTGILIGIG